MRAILIPVKDLSAAKLRLRELLPQEARTALARAMLQDVFKAVAAARGYDAVFVVSSDGPALSQARALGWEIIREYEQISESVSVDAASRHCEALGVRSLLRLPIDVPLVQPADIQSLLDASMDAPVVMAPSRDATGTNALLRTPPTVFPSQFGPGSLEKHFAEARRVGAQVKIIRNPRLALDVDDEQDLRAFLTTHHGGTATGACLHRLAAIHPHLEELLVVNTLCEARAAQAGP